MTVAEEIRAKVDLVELIGESVPLKQSGKNFKANCPFHNERTPSFYVFPDRQAWHCFGACATGGDAFAFVMRRDVVAFPEALRVLAARAGVELESREGNRARAGKLDELRAINRAAANFFHQALLSSPEAQGARDHLLKRGISKETIEGYRLGYSHAAGAGLFRVLNGEGHSEEAILLAGLFRKRDDGSGMYPFFRSRLMVPIQDAKGDYAGFGARELDGSKPKYLNSAQSPLFDKSNVLYGLYQGAEMIRKERLGVLVEGYMDVLMAHQYGFKNVVAAMGVALSDRQVATLRRLSSTFVLALDPDAAGDEATLRSLESSWRILDQPAKMPSTSALLTGPEAQELVLKVMDLPRGIDPDEVIREDPANWTKLQHNAVPVIDYVFTSLAKRFDLTSPRGKDAMTKRVAPFILQTQNVFEQNQRIRKLAALLGEQEQVVKLALGGGKAQPVKIATSWRPAKESASLARASRDTVGEYCLAMLLRYPELLTTASALTEEHFSSAPLREMYKLLAQGCKSEDLRGALPEELEEDLDALLSYKVPPTTFREREQGILETVRRLEDRRLKLQSRALQAQMGEDPSAPHLAPAAEELRGRLLRNSRKSG